MFQRCGTKSHLKGGEEMKYEVDLKQRLYSITEKYVVLVEKRIDEIEKLTGKDLEDIYTSIQMLGHFTATLERLNRIKNSDFLTDESFQK